MLRYEPQEQLLVRLLLVFGHVLMGTDAGDLSRMKSKLGPPLHVVELDNCPAPIAAKAGRADRCQPDRDLCLARVNITILIIGPDAITRCSRETPVEINPRRRPT
jgi:hypothetical protein